MSRRRQRPSQAIWQRLRQFVWERDGGYCQGPHCRGAPPLPLEHVHIDHRIPRVRGGSDQLDNLRTLCRRCHVLRADNHHRGMLVAALRDGVIPPDWRPLVWEDEDDGASHQTGANTDG